MVKEEPELRTPSTLPSCSGRLSRQVGSSLLWLRLPSSKRLTGSVSYCISGNMWPQVIYSYGVAK
jgi:hypothetical protein